MSDQDTLIRLMDEVGERSRTCERGILAVGYNPFGMPVLALTLVAPNCVNFTQVIAVMPNGEPIFADLVLN